MIRNDVTSFAVARWVWDLFRVEFFFIVLASVNVSLCRSVSEQSVASDVLLQTRHDRVQMVRAADQGRKIHPEGMCCVYEIQQIDTQVATGSSAVEWDV